MQDRRDPWKWPVTLGLTFTLLAVFIFAVPRSWYDFFFSPLNLRSPDKLSGESWLTLMAPPEIQIEPESPINDLEDPPPPEPPPQFLEQDWWTRGLEVHLTDQAMAALKPSVDDSLRYVMNKLSITSDLLRTTRPDSLLSARLILLGRMDALDLEELKPYLKAMTRSRAWADIHSREAAMFDNHLGSQIMVPD